MRIHQGQGPFGALAGELKRIESYRNSSKLEHDFSSYKKAGIPSNLIDGILLSREHYGEIDSEYHKLNVLRSLAIAEGDTPQTKLLEKDVNLEENLEQSNDIDYKTIITEYIQQNNSPNGTDFESIVTHCLNNKGEREVSEITIENMVDDGELFEVKFGWYKLVT